MSTSVLPTRPEIELPRKVSETFTDEPSIGSAKVSPPTIRVPSCRPTPLIGSWADESWPLNSRQASEIITEQVLQQQRSSIIFEDDEGNVLMNDDAATQEYDGDDRNSSMDVGTIDESLMQEAMSHAQISTEEVQSEMDSPTHMAQSFMYNPYNVNDAKVVLHRCTCEVCGPMLYQKHHQEQLLQTTVQPQDSASNQVSPAAMGATMTADPKRNRNMDFLAAPPQEVLVQQEMEDEGDWDLPTYKHGSNPCPAPAPQFHQFPSGPMGGAAPAAGGFMTHTQLSSPPFMDMNTPTPSPGNMQATPGSNVSGLSHPPPTQRRVVQPGELPTPPQRDLTTFMPPPPPPRIATMVYEEEGSVKNPSGIYYHLLMRWYAKVQESQEYFIVGDDRCPRPNKDKYSFEEWADEVSGWWYTHFEHMQKKAPRFARAGRR